MSEVEANIHRLISKAIEEQNPDVVVPLKDLMTFFIELDTAIKKLENSC